MRVTMRILSVFALLMIIVGCNNGGGTVTKDVGIAPASQTPCSSGKEGTGIEGDCGTNILISKSIFCLDRSNILWEFHPGWLINDCTQCHNLPVVNHDSNITSVADCASCHGTNGAPVVADTLGDTHPGWQRTDCTLCHSSIVTHNAGLTAPECSSCHGGNGAPILADTHTGWKNNNCTPCHAQPITGHEDNLPLPRCASCHGGNAACARPWVTWHPKGGCSSYNCHGPNHGYTDNLECGKCHFASSGVFQCTIYQ